MTTTQSAPAQHNHPAAQSATAAPPPHPGMSPNGRYFVLPYAMLAQLPAALQHEVANVLERVRQATARHPWAAYQVVPSRWEQLGNLDETDLREHGVMTEIDADGELVYRNLATGEVLDEQQRGRQVLVPCPDPWQPPPTSR